MAKSVIPIPFDWGEYLRRIPAEVAPNQAFMQSDTNTENKFLIGMKLEARDPKNDPTHWSLAGVVSLEGSQRIRLRFEGSDSMSDIFELVNSNNIKPLFADDVLYPPMAYRGNIATYPNFVKKTLDKPNTVVATQDCFEDMPEKPPRNLFKIGHKLEAVDRKNPHVILPATVVEIHGDDLKISFDGWSGSFDYSCKYYSRDIFPVNWCKKTGHIMIPPKGWEPLIAGTTSSLSPEKSLHRTVQRSPVKTVRENLNNNSTNGTCSSSVTINNNNIKSFNTNSRNSMPVNNSHQSRIISNASVSSDRMKIKVKQTPKRQQGKILNNSEFESMPRHNLDQQLSDKQQMKEIKDFDEAPLPPGVDKYQCLRTLPYEEWKRLKKEFNNVKKSGDTNGTPRSDSIQSSTDQNGTNMTYTPTPPTKRLRYDQEISSSMDNPVNQSTSSTQTISVESWSVQQVIDYLVRNCPDLIQYSELFEDHKINGKAFLMLTTDIMVRYMGLKVGPTIEINQLIERAKRM